MTIYYENQDGSKSYKYNLKTIWIKEDINGNKLCFKSKNDKSQAYNYIFIDEIKTETLIITE